jgi:hypothetical protein
MSGRLLALLALPSVALISCSSGGGGAGPAPGDAGGTVDAGTADAPSLISQTVGAGGGTVAASGVTLTIPAAALAGDTTITVDNAGAVPPGYVGLSPLFHFGPDGTVFLKPVTVDFTISGGTSPAVFWSNAQGGFDQLATTSTATLATATVTHFSKGFCGEGHGSGVDASASGSSSGMASGSSSGGSASGSSSGSMGGSSSGSSASSSGSSSSSSGSSGGMIADSGSDAVDLDSSTPGIVATVDGVPTSFVYNVKVSFLQAWWQISADDSPSGAHWTLTLMTPMTPGGINCQGAFPSIYYRHYAISDAGAADMTFSSVATTASCFIDETTSAVDAGQSIAGTFSGVLVPQGDAGTGSHTFSGGTYDVIVP